jgi:hypothetical protein
MPVCIAANRFTHEHYTGHSTQQQQLLLLISWFAL